MLFLTNSTIYGGGDRNTLILALAAHFIGIFY